MFLIRIAKMKLLNKNSVQSKEKENTIKISIEY